MHDSLIKLLLSLSLISAGICGQAQHAIKGLVTDENGDEMAGVIVYEKGTNNSTITDVNGSYSLKYKDRQAVFIFNFVGFKKQEISPAGKEEWNITLKQGAETEMVGSRRPDRVSTETPVPIDIIEVSKVTNSYGQVDINQLLHYAAPSFNANRQSGSDAADHIDPATLRGLGPDQILVLINGKRRHQSSSINLYGTRGRGNTGTDLNAIPAAAIERIEILRDGASAQYGSDAIAGVINIVLKSNVNELTANATAGFRQAHPPDKYDVVTDDKIDGETYQANVNYGVKIGEDGFLNMTADYTQSNHTHRPVDPSRYAIYRRQFGDAARHNFAAYANTSFKAGEKISFYGFGGFNYRFTDAYAFTRNPESERNVLSIYPNGFDPRIQSVITDKSISLGAKANLRKWTLDANNTFGVNRIHFYVDGTLNASLEEKTPTRFDAGSFKLLQNTTALNFSRLWEDVLKGFNIAIGGEHRIENYGIFAGEEGSWQTYGPVIFSVDTSTDSTGAIVSVDTTFRPGGAQGFPGFRPANEVDESRTNIGVYIDAELDVTKWLLFSGAVRLEKYSDFGTTVNGKFAARIKILKDILALRGSVSSGFRAPSLVQLYYNATITNVVSGNIMDKIIAKNNSAITRELGIPQLDEEKSVNGSVGLTSNFKGLTISVDGYYVKVRDRIVLTGAFDADNSPEVADELNSAGVVAAQFFTNAVNTSTLGLDVIAAYTFKIKESALRISYVGNFNHMEVDDIYTNTKLAGKEDIYFGKREQYFLLASAPKSKMSLAADYAGTKFNASLRFILWGKMELMNFANHIDVYDPKITTDFSVGYNITKNVNLTAGSTNRFNVYSDQQDPENSESGGLWDAVQMGFSGAFWYAKLGLKY